MHRSPGYKNAGLPTTGVPGSQGNQGLPRTLRCKHAPGQPVVGWVQTGAYLRGGTHLLDPRLVLLCLRSLSSSAEKGHPWKYEEKKRIWPTPPQTPEAAPLSPASLRARGSRATEEPGRAFPPPPCRTSAQNPTRRDVSSHQLNIFSDRKGITS